MRKKKLLFMIALLCAVVQSVWAQNGIYCTASDVGRVVCTDGSIYDNVSAATAAGSHAVAKIIWVDEKNKKGLALNLWDEGYANRTDGIERCNNKNTSDPVAGAAWKLATKDEWDTMIDAAGGQQNLANGFSSVGGNNLNTSYGYYATSSVTSYAPNRKYDVYKFGSYSGWTESKNDLACLVRPCLTFNLLTLYTINNQNDWFNFCDKVNGGDTFSDKYVKITCNDHWLPIVSEMAGTDETHSFQGVFDGNGHTITFNVTVTATEDYCAPFRHVKNAVIKNLRVNGQIYVSGKFTAGIVAASHGNLTITNCRSSVGIHSSRSGDCTHAGFVALLNGADNAITINNCVFDGEFTTTASTGNCGGFIGWPVYNRPTIKNSIMMPEKVDAGMLTNTFARWHEGYEPTITDCYFVSTANLPTDQGTQADYATLPENEICKPITTTNPVVKTLYSVACTVSGVKDSYKLDGVPANITPAVTDPNGTALALGNDFTATLNGNAVVSFPVSILTAGNYTLVLTAAGDYVGSKTFNFTVTGTLGGMSEDDAFIIKTEDDWNAFANNVNSGTNSYTSMFVKLDADISVTQKVGMVSGSTQQNAFSGTFLGQGHTITATIEDNDNQGTALFSYINGATIKDLNVAGTITSNKRHAAALVGFSKGKGNSIENCVVSANVNGNEYVGGIVGHSIDSDISISGCVFSGKMTGGGKCTRVFIGWGDSGTRNVTDCLYLIADGQNTSNFDLVKDGGTLTVTNCYKTTSAGSQGMQVYASVPEGKICKKQTICNTTLYNMTECTVSGIAASYNLGDGANVTPVVKYNNNSLTFGTNFTATLNGTAVTELPVTITTIGHNTLILTGTGDYVGSKSYDIYLRPGNNSNIELADGETYTITEDCATASATYRKTLGSDRVGKHQPWLVPFDYTITENDLVKFDFYKINMIANAPNPKTNATDGISVYLRKMSTKEVLHANIPYVYRPKTTVENYEFTTQNAGLKAKNTGVIAKTETLENIYSFYATYEPTTATAADPFYYVNIDDAMSLGNDGSVTVGAFRWIIRVEDKFGKTSANAREIHFFTGEGGDLTGIGSTTNFTNDTNSAAWYTLEGHRLDGKPTRAGLYINNGNIVVIKQ